MAASKNTTGQSVIAILAAKREAVYARADVEGLRTLTDAEHAECEAIATVIASLPATGRKDARTQVAVAREILELVRDGLNAPDRLELAHAALASASRAMAPRKRAA